MRQDQDSDDLQAAVYALLLSPDASMRELGWLQAEAQGIDVRPLLAPLHELLRISSLSNPPFPVPLAEHPSQFLDSILSANTLSCTDQRLYQLPDGLRFLHHFESLELSHNRIESLPDYLAQYTSLTSLYLDNNWLPRLPESLCTLPRLRSLNLHNNFIEQLPFDLGHLVRLEHLNLSNNVLRQLPSSIGQFQQLEVLDLRGNWGIQLPAELGQCRALRELHLQKTGWQLHELPPAVQGLQQSGTTILVSEQPTLWERIRMRWSRWQRS